MSAARMLVLTALAAIAVAACETPYNDRRPPEQGSAVLEGVVLLAQDVDPGALPAYTREQLGWYTLLPGDRGSTGCEVRDSLQVLHVGEGRGVGSVLVAASGFTGKHRYPQQTHRVIYERCRLSPSLVTATAGDVVEVENRGPGAVPITFGTPIEPFTLPVGRKHRLMPAPGVESLMCPRGVGCGRTDVVTFHHSLHAVTDADGRFRIEGFPAGQSVAVHAWHPLLPESRVQVWLERGETQQVQLVIRPRESP